VAIPIYVKQISFSECVLLQDCSETYWLCFGLEY